MNIQFPLDVTLKPSEELCLQDMDDYDPDSYDEESIDHLGMEQGLGMEPVTVESFADLKKELRTTFKGYSIADSEIAEAYHEWCDR